MVDPQNVLRDVNQQNNIFYTTGQKPVTFVSGISDRHSTGAFRDSLNNTLEVNRANLLRSKYNTSIGEDNRNAYTPNEILNLVKAKYKSGELQQKLNTMQNRTTKMSPQVK